jgi:hypothetical protein
MQGPGAARRALGIGAPAHTTLSPPSRPQAFRAYDEAGNPRRVACLKYLVLANMLMQSNVDPFDSQARGPGCLFPCVCVRGCRALGWGAGSAAA